MDHPRDHLGAHRALTGRTADAHSRLAPRTRPGSRRRYRAWLTASQGTA
ncbi:hypothetical protein [Streptomyces griseofuscus]